MRKSASSKEDPDLRPQPQITARDLEIDDLAPVYRLGKRVFTKSSLPALYRTWDPYEVTYYFNTDPDFCFVAETDSSEIAGFALGTTIDKDGGAWRYGYLAWLGVAPEHQREGVASKLLKEFERRMRDEGVRMLIVDTEGNNANALKFFERHGFAKPTSHVWLTKPLGRRNGASITQTGGRLPKPMKPARVAARSKRPAVVLPVAKPMAS